MVSGLSKGLSGPHLFLFPPCKTSAKGWAGRLLSVTTDLSACIRRSSKSIEGLQSKVIEFLGVHAVPWPDGTCVWEFHRPRITVRVSLTHRSRHAAMLSHDNTWLMTSTHCPQEIPQSSKFKAIKALWRTTHDLPVIHWMANYCLQLWQQGWRKYR